MIVTVNKETAVRNLTESIVEHCGEIIEIKQCGIEFFCKPQQDIRNHRMIKYIIRDMAAYEVVSADTSFVNECLAYIADLELPKFTLYLPSWYTLSTWPFKEYDVEKTSTYADFILPEEYAFDLLEEQKNIKLLEEKDLDLASGFSLVEAISGRPSFEALFGAIVLQNSLPGGGKIFAYLKENQIVAYLSCFLFEETIYDIDHVYVLPQYRKQGIAKSLVKHYIKSTITAGKIPRYGNAENQNSMMLAKKSGFVEVKCQDKYILKKSRTNR